MKAPRCADGSNSSTLKSLEFVLLAFRCPLFGVNDAHRLHPTDDPEAIQRGARVDVCLGGG